jgi:hypothetical protein
VETIDLSFLTGTPGREFRKECQVGEEKGSLRVDLFSELTEGNMWEIRTDYYGPIRPRPALGAQFKRREFWRFYSLEKVPAGLSRALVRLGATDEYMLRLQAAYAEILAQVSGVVEHEDVHTDTGPYDE